MLFLQVFQPTEGNCARQGSTSRCNSSNWWNYSSWFVGKYQFNVFLLLCGLFPVIFYCNPFRCYPRENVPYFDNILCKKILKQICIIERKPYPNLLPIFCSTLSSRDVGELFENTVCLCKDNPRMRVPKEGHELMISILFFLLSITKWNPHNDNFVYYSKV